MSTLSSLLEAFIKPFADRMADRLVPKPMAELPPKERLDYAKELREESKAEAPQEAMDPLRLEMLGEFVFSAQVPGHVLQEILKRSPSPKQDVAAYLRGRRRIKPRLEEGRVAMTYDPPSNTVELIMFLLLASGGIGFIWGGLQFLLKQPMLWRSSIAPFLLGAVLLVAAWGLLKSDLEFMAARTLVRSLYPPTETDKALLEERKREGRKKNWKGLIWGLVGVVVLALVQYFTSFKVACIVLGTAVGITVAVAIVRCAWRDFYPEKPKEPTSEDASS